MLGIAPDTMKNNIEHEIRRRRKADGEKELQTIKLAARNYGDLVNPDAAKNVAANAAEEAVLGMLLVRPILRLITTLVPRYAEYQAESFGALYWYFAVFLVIAAYGIYRF